MTIYHLMAKNYYVLMLYRILVIMELLAALLIAMQQKEPIAIVIYI